MANLPISSLPAAGDTVATTTQLPVVRSGAAATEKATLADVAKPIVMSADAYTPGGIGAVARTVSEKLDDLTSVADFDVLPANSNNVTAWAAAIGSGKTALFVPPGTYLFNAAISIPAGVSVYAVPNTVTFSFPAGATGGVAVGTANTNSKSVIRGLKIVSRATGSGDIAGGSYGLKVVNGSYVEVDQVVCEQWDYGFWWRADTAFGISSYASGLFSGKIKTAHVLIDGWPELYVSKSRFGQNGSGDYNTPDMVRFTGGNAPGNPFAGMGPNTINFHQCHFNPGVTTSGFIWNFASMLGSGSSAVIYTMSDCHCENVGGFIKVDAATGGLTNLNISNTMLNSGVEFWNLASGVNLFNVTIDRLTTTGTFTLTGAGSGYFNNMLITRCNLGGAVSITSGSAASVMVFAQNNVPGGATFAGAYGSLQVLDNISTGAGTITVTSATGTVVRRAPNDLYTAGFSNKVTSLTIENASGFGLGMNNTGAGADLKRSFVNASSGGTLTFGFATDNLATANNYMTITRTGATPTSITFGASISSPILATPTLRPGATATPSSNGDLVFEATSDTQIRVRLRGSDGTVRSASLTLS